MSIPEESTRQLVLRLRGGFQIFVQTLTGKTITLKAKVDDTIESIKKKIQEREGVPVGLHRLIRDNRLLKDGRTLADYNIGNYSTLYFTLNI